MNVLSGFIIITQNWKPPKCRSRGYTKPGASIQQSTTQQRNEINYSQWNENTSQKNLKYVIVSERSQIQKAAKYMILFI